MAKHPNHNHSNGTHASAQEHGEANEVSISTNDEANDAAETPSASTPVATADYGTSTFELKNAGLNVTVANKYGAGMTINDAEAGIINAFLVRQFTNNMDANAKARAERLAKATTDAERAANQPLTADAYAAEFVSYFPNVGGAPRLSTVEKNRRDAALRAWARLVAEHNKAILSGPDAVSPLPNAGRSAIPPLRAPAKSKGTSEEAHKSALEAFEVQKEGLIDALLSKPAYADRVAAELAAIEAERAKAKATDAIPTVTIGAGLL